MAKMPFPPKGGGGKSGACKKCGKSGSKCKC